MCMTQVRYLEFCVYILLDARMGLWIIRVPIVCEHHS